MPNLLKNAIVFYILIIIFNSVAVRPLSIQVIFWEIIIATVIIGLKYRVTNNLTLNPVMKEDSAKPFKEKLKYSFYFFLGGIVISVALAALLFFGIITMSFTYEPMNQILSFIPILIYCMPFLGIIVGYVYGVFKKQ